MKIRLRLALISIALTAASMAVCGALLLNATAKSNLALAEENARAELAVLEGSYSNVLRDVSERPEAMMAGTAKLVGTSANDIFNAADTILANVHFPENTHRTIQNNPFGDGNASGKIADVILKYFNDRS